MLTLASIAGQLADPAASRRLYAQAAATRRQRFGDQITLRALLEVSNTCRCSCAYCGIGAFRRDLARYRLGDDAVLEACARALRAGYQTVVLQGGEDPQLVGTAHYERVARWIRAIKAAGMPRVTLSLGEPDGEALACWREAGADRYLLRFETSNPELYTRLHPGQSLASRLATLEQLRRLGYEVGSGMLIGLPGQTVEDIAADLLLCRELALDMVGLGPFLPAPGTPLGAARVGLPGRHGAELVYRALALARLLCPGANIPATTALETRDVEHGRWRALAGGANVVMVNFTPWKQRQRYALYPDKASAIDPLDATRLLVAGAQARGQRVVWAPGDARHGERRHEGGSKSEAKRAHGEDARA